MINKNNILFPSFGTRFVFEFSEVPVSGGKPDAGSKEKPETPVSGENPDAGQFKDARAQLQAAVEAKETLAEKPYSITKLEGIRQDAIAALSKIKGSDNMSKEEERRIIEPISEKIKVAGDALKSAHEGQSLITGSGDLVYEKLLKIADPLKRQSTKWVLAAVILALPEIMIWINPTTKQEQQIVLNLFVDVKAQQERAIQIHRNMQATDASEQEAKMRIFTKRQLEVEGMQLPQ